MSYVITAFVPTNDHAAQYILDMQTVGLCYARPLNNSIQHARIQEFSSGGGGGVQVSLTKKL